MDFSGQELTRVHPSRRRAMNRSSGGVDDSRKVGVEYVDNI